MWLRIANITKKLSKFLMLLGCVVALLLLLYNISVYEVMKNRNTSYLIRNKKYILQWTNSSKAPFNFMKTGNLAFVKNKCKYTNCFVTNNTSSMDETDFDAIVFNGRDIVNLRKENLPKRRNTKQKYIFGAMESADNFPVCDVIFDKYFNWTWSYKLDSEFRWGYITIYDLDRNVVGPKIDIEWPRLKPIDEVIKKKLSSKTRVAAWFVSHCSTKSGREIFMKSVQNELEVYGLSVDIYGSCGTFSCPKSKAYSCFNIIERDYYFYFSLENSFSEDYVTEKLLVALNNYAVPIVFGSANYSRFLPPGSYLDGRELGPHKLAKSMSEIINNTNLYYDFFRWRNHFRYKETSSNEDICKLCEMMNNEEKMAKVTVWHDFRAWWNGARYSRNC